MKNYLYENWAHSTLFMAVSLILVFASSFTTMPLVILLIWLQFPVYLIHQFEEHVYPGHFKEFINRTIFKSAVENVPLSTKAVFWINILAIWFLFPIGAVCAQNISPEFGVLLPVFGLFNASLHILMFIIKKCYNPGLFVSVTLNYPTGIYTLWILDKERYMTSWALFSSLIITILAHALILVLVKQHEEVPVEKGVYLK